MPDSFADLVKNATTKDPQSTLDQNTKQAKAQTPPPTPPAHRPPPLAQLYDHSPLAPQVKPGQRPQSFSDLVKGSAKPSDFHPLELSPENHGALDKFNAMMDLIPAAAASILGGKQDVEQTGKALKDIGNKFLHLDPQGAMNEAVDYTRMYAPGSQYILNRITQAQQGNALAPLAQGLIDHPTLNAVTSWTLDAFFNPANWLLGGVGGVAAKGLSLAAKGSVSALAASGIPVVAKTAEGVVYTVGTVNKTLRSFFDQYHGLRADLGPEAAAIAHQGNVNIGHVQALAQDWTDKVFGGTTREQQREIVRAYQRLAYSKSRRGRANPLNPMLTGEKMIVNPAIPETDGLSILDRATRLNAYISYIDKKQLQLGLAKKDDMISIGYFPKPRKLTPAEMSDLEPGQMPRTTSSSGYKEAKGTLKEDATFKTLEAREEWDRNLSNQGLEKTIPEDWVAAQQFHQWAQQKLLNTSVTQTINKFKQAGMLIEKDYQYVDKQGNVLKFGSGKAGYEKAQKYANEQGAFIASIRGVQDAQGNVIKGIPPRKPNLGASRMKASEAQYATRKTGRIPFNQAMGILRDAKKFIDAGMTPQTVELVTRGGRRALRLNETAVNDMKARATRIQQEYVQAQAGDALRRKWQREFTRATSHWRDVVLDKIVRGSDEQAISEGFKPYEYQPQFHATAAEHTALRPAVYQFFVDAGAAPHQANPVSIWIDTLNKWNRIGIIANPVVHVAWNLFHAYLGSGGDITKIADMLHTPLDAVEYARAARAGAIAPMRSSRSMLANPEVAQLMTLKNSELTPAQRVDKALTRGWLNNQKFVFETVEAKMAVQLFKQFKAGGLTDGEAGFKVRQALGNYFNISAAEKNAQLNRIFYFYGWMKTAIPFWTTDLNARKVGMINSPMTGTRAYNQNFGINTPGGQEESNPYALHLGGGDNSFAPPFPERYFGLAAQAVLGDRQGNEMSQHISKGVWTLLGHMNPFAAALTQSAYTVVAPANTPGNAPLIMWDKRQSIPYNVKDVAGGSLGAVLSNTLGGFGAASMNVAIPGGLGSIIGGLVGGAGQMASANLLTPQSYRGQAASAGPETMLSIIPGGYWKIEKDPQYRKLMFSAQQEASAIRAKYSSIPGIQAQLDELLEALKNGDAIAPYRLRALYDALKSGE